MGYAAWSVIAGEQPTTSKWNILGTNDSSFNDGSGLAFTTNNVVPGNALATSAINLASVSSSTNQSGVGAAYTIVTGLTATVAVPAGTRKVRIEAFVPWVSSTNIASNFLGIYNSATVTGSVVNEAVTLQALAGTKVFLYCMYEHAPAAGSQSYCAAINTDTGTCSTSLAATRLAWLSVKAF